MAKQPRWKMVPAKNGVLEIEFSSWKYFHDYIRQQMLDYSHYVWRGQRDSGWKLESSLDRLLKAKPKADRPSLANRHLERFQLAARGRRGPNPSRLDDENEWWALGQHQSLATPLLDWTESPFVALYFAFERAEKPSSGKRVVWAISHTGSLVKKNKEIAKAHVGADRAPILEFIKPHHDDNARLVSQAGLFSRGPLGIPVEAWIEQHYAGIIASLPLIKLVIPDKERPECLRTLNRMNINHVTLFPDLYGAGQHCNKALQIDKY